MRVAVLGHGLIGQRRARALERLQAHGQVVDIGRLTRMGLGGDGGAALELGFYLQMLEALHLRAPCRVFGFHLRGDVGFRGIDELK